MNLSSKLMIGALGLNVIILAPVVAGILSGWPFNPMALGAKTPGLMVLASIYASIALVSAFLIYLHLRQMAWAVPMTLAMFAVQITYKAITVPLVGLANPVVLANVLVIFVQAFVLAIFITEKQRT